MTSITRLTFLAPFFCVVPVFAQVSDNGDLLRFLPNNGNSVYQARGLPRSWPPAGPKKLWTAEIGWGKGAVVESQGRAFTVTEIDDQQHAICLDAHTGKTLWTHLLYPKNCRHFAWGPGTSPVIDGERIYFIPYAIFENDVWEMRCPIVCLDMEGKELWRVDEDVWATEASTPLVEGDTLFVSVDNPDRAVLAAFDKSTGKLRWKTSVLSDRNRELGAPSSLTYQVVDGIPQVIVATYGSREVLGMHADTGEIMWRYPYPEPLVIGLVSTPVAIGNRLLLSAGEGKGKDFFACLQMSVSGGRIQFKELYVDSELQANTYNTPAVFANAVFGFGGNKRIGFLHATNLDDGALLWRHDSEDWTSEQNLVVADGLIFAITQNEELVMAEASRTAYRELGRMKLDIEIGRPQQPTLANGRMYIRGTQAVSCYELVSPE